MKRLSLACALAGALCLPTLAQDATLPFPFDVTAAGAASALQADDARLLELAYGDMRSVRMTGVPAPGGGLLELELERVELDTSRLQLQVDGRVEPRAFAPETSLWSGRVVGDSSSDVFLAFSPWGSRGWYRTGGETLHLLTGPSAAQGWDRPLASLMPQSQLDGVASLRDLSCDVASAPGGTVAVPTQPRGSSLALGTNTLECFVAWETDFQLFQQFANLNALESYVAMLLGAVGQRYREQINVELVPVYLAFYTNANDPWTTPDSGGSTGDMLNEFRDAWAFQAPNGAHLSHFLSGASLGGGVAWLNALCSPDFGFAVSANLTQFGLLPGSPAMQGPFTWDFYVICHELGHNFGSPHTFDYSPQIDDCPNSCISSGTIMSYCHLCPGGNNNITTFFHPTVVNVMRQAAEASCLPELCQGSGANYCTAAPNSFISSGAQIGNSGSRSLTANDMVLFVQDAAPSQFGVFFYGMQQVLLPLGDGFRCVGGPAIYRLPPASQADIFGIGSRVLDFDEDPLASTVTAGSTWHFQYWYRDPAGGPAGSNLSNGLTLTFCP